MVRSLGNLGGLENPALPRHPYTMKLPRRAAKVPQALPSERGFLEMAGRDGGIPLREAFLHFRDLVSADMDWADSRKLRFRRRASRAKLAALALTAASTVVLGIPAIPDRAAIALPMVAIVTLISALEPFFNWRSPWVLMEETQYRLNRIRDEMDYYLVMTPEADLSSDRLRRFFTDQQDIWEDVSRQWIEFRKHDQSQPGGSPPLNVGTVLPPPMTATEGADRLATCITRSARLSPAPSLGRHRRALRHRAFSVGRSGARTSARVWPPVV
jgi:hypothetical protein